MTFLEAWSRYEPIQYGFTRDEAAALFALCENSPPGLYVEAGSMQGGSACIAAAAGREVLCVDPWDSSTYYRMFRENCRNLPIHHIRGRDSDVWNLKNLWKSRQIGLILIDHDHSLESTTASLNGWRPLLQQGSPVLVHDYGDSHWVDVKPAVDSSWLKIEGVVGRLAWGRSC